MRRGRFLLALAALVLLAIVSQWLLSQDTPAVVTAELVGRYATDEISGGAGSGLAAPAAGPARSASDPARELVARDESEIAARHSTPPDLRGRLVLIELDGTELTDAYGSLTWTRWVSLAPEHHQVPVVNGEWVVAGESLLGVRAVSFKGVHLGVQRASIEAPLGLHKPPFADEFVVRARLLASASLRVVDAGSGLDLDGVALVTTSSSPGGRRHPGVDFESSILASGLRSPIFLEEPLFPRRRFGSSGSNEILVGAPGFAWTRVDIDLGEDGEQVAALDRGADLALNVRGCSPSSRARVRLRRGGEEPGEEYAVADLRGDGYVRFSGLPSGPLHAIAEVGSDASSIELGTLDLELRAGELTEGTLVLSAAPPLVLADANGIVLVPTAWEASRPRLELRLLDPPLGGFPATRSVQTKQVSSTWDGFDAFAWSEIDLQVGTYVLSVAEPRHATKLAVPPGGLAAFEVFVPAPVELLVHLIDEATALPVGALSLHWMLKTETGEVFAVESKMSDAAGLVRVQAPACELQLIVRSDEYRRHAKPVDLRAGPREVTLRLQKACGFTLQLTYGGVAIELPGNLRKHFRGTGPWESITTTPGERKCRIGLRDPGTFSFSLPELPGYEVIPQQTVVVLPGQFTEHVIELKRME